MLTEIYSNSNSGLDVLQSNTRPTVRLIPLSPHPNSRPIGGACVLEGFDPRMGVMRREAWQLQDDTAFNKLSVFLHSDRGFTRRRNDLLDLWILPDANCYNYAWMMLRVTIKGGVA